ncbi:hypothetical protein [Lampropedia aestuarii]|uniref:hypothetical protein n=1 Tax=Lampropedia aestuarii TaxID=2562762 RepID=UPI00246940B2|nr:hypothetical protein [Lampropedia aestuarii]MDH5856932.1 hypothetical protein [Lampropedia aestuarii]
MYLNPAQQQVLGLHGLAGSSWQAAIKGCFIGSMQACGTGLRLHIETDLFHYEVISKCALNHKLRSIHNETNGLRMSV